MKALRPLDPGDDFAQTHNVAQAQRRARYRLAQAAWEKAVDAASHHRSMTPAEEALGVAATRAMHQLWSDCDCAACAPDRSIAARAAAFKTSILRIGT